MIIDFHTHVFPDRIATKTISLLSKNGGIPPFSDGTVNGLCQKMREAGTDISVTLPVMTSPTQFDSINNFAKEYEEILNQYNEYKKTFKLYEEYEKKYK